MKGRSSRLGEAALLARYRACCAALGRCAIVALFLHLPSFLGAKNNYSQIRTPDAGSGSSAQNFQCPAPNPEIGDFLPKVST